MEDPFSQIQSHNVLHNQFEMEQSDWSYQHSSSTKLFVHDFTKPSFRVGCCETTCGVIYGKTAIVK